MGQRFVTSLKLPPTPSDSSGFSWSRPHSRALSDRPPAHLQNTLVDPQKGHHFEQIPIHPAGLLGGKSAATSPPAGGLDARHSGEQEETGREVTFTTTVNEPRVIRAPEPTTPDGGASAGVTADAGVAASGGSGSGAGSGSAPAAAVPCNCVVSLDASGSGAIEGSYGINDYWPGVTPYWGAHKTLGNFDTTSGSGKLFGHKFQVVGKFKSSTGAVAGEPTFKQMARLSVGTASPGTTGSWFDDMDYTDAGGVDHHWDPNAEAGTTVKTGYPGVRRTIATDKYSYTDPPAIYYEPGTTDTYRKLEFSICFNSPTGCSCPVIQSCISRTQEIEVKKGVPSTLKSP
jgi:hypothetical protein